MNEHRRSQVPVQMRRRSARAALCVTALLVVSAMAGACRPRSTPEAPLPQANLRPEEMPVVGEGYAGCASTFAEQLRRRCFGPHNLAEVVPGFTALADSLTGGACTYIVYLTDPARFGDTARRLLDPLLPDSPVRRQECAPQGLLIRGSEFDYATLRTLHDRAAALVRSQGFEPRTHVGFVRTRILIEAHNQRAHDVLRSLVARDSVLAASEPVFRLQSPQELDPPILPPRSASLLVLDSLATRHAANPRAFIALSTLPPGVTAEDAAVRGLRPRPPDLLEGCAANSIAFLEVRQWENGRLRYWVREGWTDYWHIVDCEADDCHIPVRALPLLRDRFRSPCE